MRLDYLATVYIASPVSRLRRATGDWPFLMYHSISTGDASVHPYYDVCTSPAVFRRQMHYLASMGRRGVSVREALALMEQGVPGDAYAVITFDDGFQNVLEEALPVLRELGFSATIYAIAEKVTAARATFKDRPCMTSGELRGLASSGFEVGSHTVTHPRLYEIPWNDVEREVGDSKKRIEDQIGSEVENFCYPYAFPEMDKPFGLKFQALVRDHGYHSNVTTIIGTARPAADRYSIPRLPVNSWDDERFFKAKISGSYNWLHAPQLAFKSLKRLALRSGS